jgi:hypothetical protein
MRMFKEMAFMGAGDYSEELITLLHARLEEGITSLSGLQQPHMSTEEPMDGQEWKMRRKYVKPQRTSY